MSAERLIVPSIERDDISWWAVARYADQGPFETYIRKTSCVTRRGAEWKARRLAAQAQRLRRRGLDNFVQEVGDPA